MADEYGEGYDANANDGQGKQSCPYEGGTPEALCWMQGWDDAEGDRFRSKFTEG